MTLITGNIKDIGLDPLSGTLIATSVEFRVTGDIIIAPEARTYPIAGGIVSADLIPGPTRLTIQVGSHARDSFDVIVPDVPVTLARLIEDAFEWSPAVVSAVAAHRAAAEAAALRAEDAAGDVDAAIAGAADQVVAAVEADRVAAEAAAGAASSSATAADSSAGDASVAAGLADERATDAASSASAAGGSATDASSSASAAAGSASAASSSATAAAGSATAADSSRSTAAGHASAASTSADEAAGHADRAETAANDFDLTATASTLPAGSDATVTVTGDGPAYGLAFGVPQGPKGDKGDEGQVSQAALDAAVASLVAGAPEALDTLTELAAALGNDPNFATTVSTEIGKRALVDGAPAAYNTLGKLVTALQNHELGGSTDASLLAGALTDQVDASAAIATLDLSHIGGSASTSSNLSGWLSALYAGIVEAAEGLDGKSDKGHQHPVTDLTATGTRSASTYLRGDGAWATPTDTNTTYSVPTQAEAEAGTATTARAFTAQRVRQAADASIAANGRLAAAPATWNWTGTTLPTSASQVNTQARVGDFIVAPNLTTNPGWHRITGV